MNEALHDSNTPSYIGVAAITTLYKAVKWDTARNTVSLATGVTDVVIGLTIRTTENAGEAIAVKRNGFAMATIGTGDWTKGAKLTADTDGTLIETTTAGDLVCAIACEAGNAGEFGEVLLLPFPLPYSSL